VGWAKPAGVEGALSPQNVEQIGRALYTDYLIPFELASFLLLVAMIGAIILAKREL
jgi:NADH-quinone oxidoreductase subunit J